MSKCHILWPSSCYRTPCHLQPVDCPRNQIGHCLIDCIAWRQVERFLVVVFEPFPSHPGCCSMLRHHGLVSHRTPSCLVKIRKGLEVLLRVGVVTKPSQYSPDGLVSLPSMAFVYCFCSQVILSWSSSAMSMELVSHRRAIDVF